jgi:hypothetical protein
MQMLVPIFQDPEYERPRDGCEIQVRWSDWFATARSSSLTTETPVFYEFSPLPGGLFLIGVGSTTTRAGDPPDSIREEILGRMLAGQSLGESVHTSLNESGHRWSRSSMYYAVVEPFGGLVDICGQGIDVSALYITGGVARLLNADSPWRTSSPLRDGDSLLLVAHPGRWSRYVLGAVERTLLDRKDHLGERDALSLCGQMRDLLPGDSASVLLHCNGSAPNRGVDAAQGRVGGNTSGSFS